MDVVDEEVYSNIKLKFFLRPEQNEEPKELLPLTFVKMAD